MTEKCLKQKKQHNRLFQCMHWISIECIINANSEVIRINYGRSTSTSWNRSWIVNSTVCSVLACAWVCVATLSFLVWNRCLSYRRFQCFRNQFDVLDSSRHMLIANGIRVFLVLFDSVKEHLFRFSDVFCAAFVALDLIHDQWFGVLDIIFERK